MSASGFQAVVHRRSAPLLTLSQDRSFSMAAAAVVQPPSPAEAEAEAEVTKAKAQAQAEAAATIHIPLLATDASDISTVTRPRSMTSSCNSAPLSTLPSSTSPPLLSVQTHHQHQHQHHHHHRLHPHSSSPEPLDKRFLSASVPPPPASLHASSRPIRVRPQSQQPSFRSDIFGSPAASKTDSNSYYGWPPSRPAASDIRLEQSGSQKPTTTASPGCSYSGAAAAAAAPSSYHRPYLSDDGQADDAAKSVNSQDLAWDQTRLRIAYLVSTMVVPGGGCSYGYGHGFGHGHGYGYGYGYSPRGSADVPPSPTSPGRTDMGLFPSVSAGARGSIGMGPGPGPDFNHDRCPEGWPGVDPVKKRRRIAQLRRWADEIAALDDQDQTFCGCAVGAPIPPYDVPESAQSSAATSTVAVGQEDVSEDVSPVSQTASASASASSTSGRCDGCGRRLMPVRPYVYVDDTGMPKARDGATRTLRRAYKSIRDLVARVKEQSSAKAEEDKAVDNNNNGNTPPLSPKQQHAFNRRLSRMRPWDQWHELNCNHMSGDFFTQTTMYHGHATPAAPETTRPPPPWLHAGAFGHDRQPPTSAAAMAAVASAGVPIHMTAHTTTSDDSSSTSSRDSGPVNTEARMRRQQRHLEARIRRAQRLLASTNGAAPAVGTQQ